MKDSSRSPVYKAILTLFILSPVVAELLSGSTPVSRAWQIPIEAMMYGPGALLIREFVRRNRLNWFSVLLLGIAYGIIEEGLSTESLFNPHFLGNDMTFGSLWGVNWIWAEMIIIYHAVWSIVLPILFAELMFPSVGNKPWLNKYGIAGFSFLYLLSIVFDVIIFIRMEKFHTSLPCLGITGVVAILFILLSKSGTPGFLTRFSLKTPSCLFAGLIAFITGILWLTLLTSVFANGFGFPPVVIAIFGLIVLMASLFIFSGWSNGSLNPRHRFAMVWGGLLAILLFGLFVLSDSKNLVDMISQVIFIIGSMILLFFLNKKVQIE